jgi:hypothetical protein
MMAKHPTQQEVAARAYQIYLDRGRQDGHAVDDWLQAEYELIQLPLGEIAKLDAPAAPRQRSASRKQSLVEVVRAAMML